ncbi:hypothetical protein ACC685_33410 [Rhizobium ruizarguesonis]
MKTITLIWQTCNDDDARFRVDFPMLDQFELEGIVDAISDSGFTLSPEAAGFIATEEPETAPARVAMALEELGYHVENASAHETRQTYEGNAPTSYAIH